MIGGGAVLPLDAGGGGKIEETSLKNGAIYLLTYLSRKTYEKRLIREKVLTIANRPTGYKEEYRRRRNNRKNRTRPCVKEMIGELCKSRRPIAVSDISSLYVFDDQISEANPKNN